MNVLFSALAPYIVPSALIIIGYAYHLVAIHIPAEKRKYIETFAKAAAGMVEQKYAGKSNEEKKALAMSAVQAFFKDFNLPAPDEGVLSAFIEAAVNALPPDVPPTTQPMLKRPSL